MINLANIAKKLIKEDAFKDYKENLPNYDPTYIQKTNDPNYATQNKINSLLLNSYKVLPDEAKYQAALLFKQWYMDKYPENQKIKHWSPDNDSQLRLFSGVGIKNVTSTV